MADFAGEALRASPPVRAPRWVGRRGKLGRQLLPVRRPGNIGAVHLWGRRQMPDACCSHGGRMRGERQSLHWRRDVKQALPHLLLSFHGPARICTDGQTVISGTAFKCGGSASIAMFEVCQSLRIDVLQHRDSVDLHDNTGQGVQCTERTYASWQKSRGRSH